MAFGPQLAQMLEADYSVIAKSGQGVVQNYAERWPYKGVHAADSYLWTFFSNEFNPENPIWDTSRFPVDAVILSIGSNDFAGETIPPTKQQFQEGYLKLIETIRSKNPGKPIICTDPATGIGGAKALEWIRQVVEKMNEHGDPDIHFIPINDGGSLLQPEDLASTHGHPTKYGARKLALYLKDKVAEILGWDFS